MDQRLRENLKIVEWELGDRVLFKSYLKRYHVLCPRWMGPTKIVQKAGPTVYLLELSTEKRKDFFQWFHSTQLKPWKGVTPDVRHKAEDQKPL